MRQFQSQRKQFWYLALKWKGYILGSFDECHDIFQHICITFNTRQEALSPTLWERSSRPPSFRELNILNFSFVLKVLARAAMIRRVILQSEPHSNVMEKVSAFDRVDTGSWYRDARRHRFESAHRGRHLKSSLDFIKEAWVSLLFRYSALSLVPHFARHKHSGACLCAIIKIRLQAYTTDNEEQIDDYIPFWEKIYYYIPFTSFSGRNNYRAAFWKRLSYK